MQFREIINNNYYHFASVVLKDFYNSTPFLITTFVNDHWPQKASRLLSFKIIIYSMEQIDIILFTENNKMSRALCLTVLL